MYYFCIAKFDGDFQISVVNKKFWEKEGYQDDRYSKNMDKIMSKAGCMEIMESVYEDSNDRSVEQLRKDLLEAGLSEDEKFTKFITSCNDGELGI